MLKTDYMEKGLNVIVNDLGCDYFISKCRLAKGVQVNDIIDHYPKFLLTFDVQCFANPLLNFYSYCLHCNNSGVMCQIKLTQKLLDEHWNNDVNLYVAGQDAILGHLKQFGRALEHGVDVILQKSPVLNESCNSSSVEVCPSIKLMQETKTSGFICLEFTYLWGEVTGKMKVIAFCLLCVSSIIMLCGV